MSLESQHLFVRATTGDRGALEQMLQAYLPRLHAYVSVRIGSALGARESSIDIVQSVCRQVLASEKGLEFDSEDRFKAWLFTAALNKMREKYRLHHGQKRDMSREEVALDATPSIAAAYLLTPSQEAIGKETAATVTTALAALSEDHREVITLARLVRLPHRVIAEVMGRSEEAVRKLLGRAMLALASELQSRGVDMERWHDQ